MTLIDVPLDTQCTVISLNNTDDGTFSRMIALGILPGAKLRVLQRKPLSICQIGFCRLAIDDKLAGSINVR